MGEKRNGIEELPQAGAAAPVPSRDRPAPHSFILRLRRSFRDDRDKPLRWHGELEHYTNGQKDNSSPDIDSDIESLLRKLGNTVRRIVG